MQKSEKPYQICSRGIWDSSVPGITFDNQGVSNYARLYDQLCEAYPRGQTGAETWATVVSRMKEEASRKRYDCVVGVSGGTDSSYLLYLLKVVYGLRPLAVTFDNGWNSEIAVKNIKNITGKLDIDLETYVIDYEEMKSIHKAYMRAGLPWIDSPTDFAIRNTLVIIARREKIKYVLGGHDFRSEGTQPHEWTHGDSRQLTHIIKTFGDRKRKTLPFLSYYSQAFHSYFLGIRAVNPYYYLDYQKKEAQKFLIDNYGWEYYGGHHHENIFTKFTIAYWLPGKFGIDKRIITLSAQVLNHEISREEALTAIRKPPYDPEKMEYDKQYVIKKLDLSPEDFASIWSAPNKTFRDYPSHFELLNKYSKVLVPLFRIMGRHKPTFLYQQEFRQDTKE